MNVKKIYIVFIILILSFCLVYGQGFSEREMQLKEYKAGMALKHGLELYTKKDYQGAIDSFLVSMDRYKEIDTEKNPKQERIREINRYLSIVYYTAGQYSKAIEYYNIRKKYEQDNSKVPLTLKKIYLKIGKKDSALAVLDEFDENHDNYAIKRRIAEIYESNGNIEEAIEYYREAFELNKNKVDILKKVALFYHKIGKDKSAIKVYNDYIVTNPPDYILRKVYRNLGIFYNKTGNKAKAVEAFENSVAIKPDKNLFFNIGHIYYNLGNNTKAKNNLLKVQEIDPDHPESHYYLGKIYQDEGNYAAALTEFQAIKDHSKYGKSAKEEIKFIKDQ